MMNFEKLGVGRKEVRHVQAHEGGKQTQGRYEESKDGPRLPRVRRKTEKKKIIWRRVAKRDHFPLVKKGGKDQRGGTGIRQLTEMLRGWH